VYSGNGSDPEIKTFYSKLAHVLS